jgi:hypothetical protein
MRKDKRKKNHFESKIGFTEMHIVPPKSRFPKPKQHFSL